VCAGPRGGEAAEAIDVDIDDARPHGDRLALDHEPFQTGADQRLADHEQGLAQAVAGLLFAGVPPQKAGELRPRLHLADGHDQVREQTLRLLGQEQFLAFDLCPKATEEPEPKRTHRSLKCWKL
jgi:hypothetical protein